MLVIRSGNRVETLARDLGRHLALHPPRDPVDPLFVVVPTRGVERFLSDHLALESGISARVRFDFPARVVRSLLRCALTGADWSTEDPPPDPWDPDRLVWHVLEALPSLLDTPSFRPLRDYLVQAEALPTGPVGREEYGLARMAADLLDEVAIYRPHWARAWSRNDPLVPRGASRPVDEAAIGAAWQRDLWRHLERRIGEHPFSRIEEAIARLEDPSFQPGLPDRICLFGIVTLPPSFLQVFLALGRRPDLEVRMDLLTCTRGYFGDTPRSRRLRRVRQGEIPLEPGEAHEGHPLVQRLGDLLADFNEILGDQTGDVPEDACEDPVEMSPPNQLRWLQHQVLELDPPSPPPTPLPCPDGSIEFHRTHTLVRQVQVLKDRILRAMDEDPTLQPRDFVVLCNDVEATAPLVEAIFAGRDEPGDRKPGSPRSDPPDLPFSISDRRPRQADPLVHATLRLLELADGRLKASEVLDFLSIEPVREAARLSLQDLDRLSALLEEAGVRFGWDEGHREALGLPRDRTFTWVFGLDRLLFGAAASPWATEDPVDGVAPRVLEDPEDLRRVGCLVRFLEELADACEVLRGAPLGAASPPEASARSLARWAEDLRRVVPRLILVEERQLPRWYRLLRALRELGESEPGESSRPVALDAFREVLEARLESAAGAAGILRGRIHVSALVPMRAIPFRVVALLGMEEDSFPRKGQRPSFDLVGRFPAPGDRNPRTEDRHLLLEAFLSARDRFWVFWNGRGVRDNRDRPLPPPLEEMLDIVARTFLPDEPLDRARDRFVHGHSLQPFHYGEYAGEGTSYDRHMVRGARALLGDRKDPGRFLTPDRALPSLVGPDRETVIRLADLARSLRNPSRELLRRRFQVTLDLDRRTMTDQEPLARKEVDEQDLLETVWDWVSRGLQDPERIRQRLLAQGRIPQGAPGEILVAEALGTALLLQRATKELRSPPARRCLVDVAFPRLGLRLEDAVPGRHGRHLVTVAFHKAGGGTLLRTWLQHLAVCATEEPDPSFRTWLVATEPGKDLPGESEHSSSKARSSIRYYFPACPRETARSLLEELAEIHVRALREPLPLFPRSSWAYACNPDPGLQNAREAWISSEHDTEIPGDVEDPYVSRVFGDADPWGPRRPDWMRVEAFDPERLAFRVYGPLLKALKPDRGPEEKAAGVPEEATR